jgi:hypothetical protein
MEIAQEKKIINAQKENQWKQKRPVKFQNLSELKKITTQNRE